MFSFTTKLLVIFKKALQQFKDLSYLRGLFIHRVIPIHPVNGDYWASFFTRQTNVSRLTRVTGFVFG